MVIYSGNYYTFLYVKRAFEYILEEASNNFFLALLIVSILRAEKYCFAKDAFVSWISILAYNFGRIPVTGWIIVATEIKLDLLYL